jgi:hypothetical protein
MNEEQANAIAAALGGEAWQSGGDIWLVLVHRQDGHLIVISDEVICEYESHESSPFMRSIKISLMQPFTAARSSSAG